jgi:hypothetical protein
MALHRDIFWVGKQWSVTGYGIQAIDPKRNGAFDIEVSRLWEDGAQERVRALKWIEIEDFDRALFIARARFPEPPRKAAAPVEEGVLGLIEAVLKDTALKGTKPRETISKEASVQANPGEPLKPVPQSFDMRIEGWPAKFVAPWRVRTRR